MDLLIPVAVVVLLLLSGIRIAQEYQRAILFRLGRFKRIKGPGLFWIIPIIERTQIVDIRTRTVVIGNRHRQQYHNHHPHTFGIFKRSEEFYGLGETQRMNGA